VSQENVELYYRVVDAFNRRNLDAFLALVDDDIEAIPRIGPVEGVYQGKDGVRRWWTDLLDAFPDFAIEVVEARDLGAAIFAALRSSGHGVESETPFEARLWHVTRWRSGKLIWWRSFASQKEALEAAGLRE
jgi:ketosteroid isomerase-like protein